MKSGYRILRKIYPDKDQKIAADSWINNREMPFYIELKGLVRLIFQNDKDRENYKFKSKFIN